MFLYRIASLGKSFSTSQSRYIVVVGLLRASATSNHTVQFALVNACSQYMYMAVNHKAHILLDGAHQHVSPAVL